MTKLADRVALVTGGSRGIGRAIAEGLAREGAAVAVNYRSGVEQAQEVVAAITGSGGRAVAVQGDVSEFASAESVVAQAVEELGGLHIVINNAGISRDALLYNMDPGEWLEVMKVNFGGVFNCTKAALSTFMKQRDGVVVNISSVMGERGWTGESNYAASKGAINAFTRCCAVELARFGIRVNAVLPGFSPTDMVAGLMDKDGGKGISKQIPLKVFATVDEVARTAIFLAGPDASHMTGALLTVDGGVSAQVGVGKPL
ncbi:MAG TPA: 3-oxoacyl-ACP reductase family protein [Solirubrobacteraceae bacterium]|jgi:3-oxoacyl-[acyl-carrier protein] reductase|nr:3-oxoacyl-ACP reductase family protein [Solirubrobacteraceae bacterium]